MDFVIEVLETVFHHGPAEATRIMLLVHKTGVGNCGVFPFEIAETKVHQVLLLAEEHSHPLQCSLEEA
jgi:ATP-dependent Clp protease adaptor protein ClpS